MPETEQKILAELVTKAQNGDSQAFGLIYDLFFEGVYRYVFLKVPKEDCEDVVSDIFLKAWKNIGQYRATEGVFRSWLFRLAHNMIVDYYRQRHDTTTIEEMEDEVVTDDTTITVDRSLDTDSLKKALTKISPLTGQAVVLRYIEDWSYADIADTMQISEGYARVLIHRGLKELKTALEEERPK